METNAVSAVSRVSSLNRSLERGFPFPLQDFQSTEQRLLECCLSDLGAFLRDNLVKCLNRCPVQGVLCRVTNLLSMKI